MSYKLWPDTRKLLKKYKSDDPVYALRTAKGEPLVRQWVKDDGQVGKVDSVRLAFVRALAAANKEHKRRPIKATVKMLRASAANLIEQNPDHKASATLFLAHSPRSIKDRHYVAVNQTQLDAAVKWLGQNFGATS